MLFLISSLYTPSREEIRRLILRQFWPLFFRFWSKTFLHEMVYVFWRVKKFVGVTLEHFWEQKMFKGLPIKIFWQNRCQGKRCANLLKFSRQKT